MGAGMRPTNSSPVVTRLLEAHGVVLGKTHMEELAEGLTTINPVYGPVLNPYNNLFDVGGELQSAMLQLCMSFPALVEIKSLLLKVSERKLKGGRQRTMAGEAANKDALS